MQSAPNNNNQGYPAQQSGQAEYQAYPAQPAQPGTMPVAQQPAQPGTMPVAQQPAPGAQPVYVVQQPAAVINTTGLQTGVYILSFDLICFVIESYLHICVY